ncbi:GspE/PulE family protein [Roseateles saccharophilus]|uniref:Type II secretory ATPase GspE/PulE/Tfp pilus assembly ATPase PilB-like protein n=1 Tax=Roseateles saccharophilus TaxID=304 RepID=A0A4R3UNG5_ROSSA|nr:ATPase, T2SS/T4P/T4SS family [Roseateles saccharophilus]MDG0833639.1 pilus assembly protein PilB [Roseateles saccharophilus]TCU93225.1 type II secretory ATPase GspE/PulE/Tfp pilus assembly ATPase PilB-like protein [Roseateles saccharophilus]
MTDPYQPLPWPDGDADTAGPGGQLSGFLWPSPPYAAYPQAQTQRGSEACEILGLNNSRSNGQLLALDASERLVTINVPPARNGMPLKFSQFRAIKLLNPVVVPPRHASDLNSPLSVDQRPRSDFRIVFTGGDELKGVTIGHQHDKLGLFLFPPLSDNDDSVRRVFIPREVLAHFEVGERIGDLLLKDNLVTPEQLNAAAVEQTGLRQKRVGDILVDKHIVTAAQLLQAIEQQARMPMVRIGEALLALDLVTPEQLDQALVQQRNDRSVPLGELLVRKGIISRAQLQSALARKMGYPVVDVENFAIEPDAVRKLPYAVAKRLEVLPLVLRDGRLIVAMEDPTRRDAIDEVEFITQLKVIPTLTRLGTLQFTVPATFERFGSDGPQRNDAPLPDFQPDFPLESSNKLIESLERDSSERSSKEDESPIEQSDNSLVRLINTMIIEAHGQGVSDIHIETYPGREKLKIRFRRDGVLQPYLELPHTYRNAMIARIKIMCDLDISERRKPQDGKINFARFSAQHKLELRVATIPTNNGLEDVVMRLLASSRPIPLDRIGLTPANLAALQTAVARPYGMVLCVGPTGSGKTTTLHSALAHINTPDRKIWTAEDPVEITQAGLRQVQVNPKIDWTFAKALRAFLRADPDVIMVGEIRDQETAEIAVEASLTGHLVLSTLHTNSAPETITRLLDMGMDPFNFADSLLAVLAQRLVRRNCTACQTSGPMGEAEVGELLDDYLHVFPAEARPAKPTLMADWIKNHGKDGRLMKFTSPGCPTCGSSGFKGRAGLHELLTVSRNLRRLIQTGARAEEIHNAALAEGMRSLRQDGIVKVLQGVTTLAEVHATSNT